jgi:hypothetical protein
MKRVCHKKLQRELQAAMLDGKYTIVELYAIYTRIMTISFDRQYKIMTLKTFSNKFTEWSNAEGSWVIKEGGGKTALYHKWQCHCSHLTRDQLRLSAKRLYEGATSWLK